MKNSSLLQGSFPEKIRRIPLSRIRGSYFRIVSTKRADEILSTQGSFAYGGRYNPPNEFGALYLGETIQVCKQERKRKSKDYLLAPQIIGKVKVSLEKVLDLTDPKILKRLGIRKEDLLHAGDEEIWDLTWAIARLAYQSGIEAILAPSVTKAGKNLIIFDKYVGKTELLERTTFAT